MIEENTKIEKRLSYDLRNAGAHWHDESTPQFQVMGNHDHLLDDMKTVFRGGDHAHDMVAETVANTEAKMIFGGAHVHFALMPDGSKLVTEPLPAGTPVDAKAGGRHNHEVLPEGEISRSGQHVHIIKFPDGSTHKTLGHDEIKALVQKNELPDEWDEVI